MSLSGHWTARPVTPSLIGETAIIAVKPDEDGVIGVVTDVEGLVVTIEDDLGDLHTFDTSDGRRIWVRAS